MLLVAGGPRMHATAIDHPSKRATRGIAALGVANGPDCPPMAMAQMTQACAPAEGRP